MCKEQVIDFVLTIAHNNTSGVKLRAMVAEAVTTGKIKTLRSG